MLDIVVHIFAVVHFCEMLSTVASHPLPRPVYYMCILLEMTGRRQALHKQGQKELFCLEIETYSRVHLNYEYNALGCFDCLRL